MTPHETESTGQENAGLLPWWKLFVQPRPIMFDVSAKLPANYPKVTPPGGDSENMTVDEVAKWLRVDKKTIYALASAGDIPHVRLGAAIRFNRHVVMQWIEMAWKKRPARKSARARRKP